MEKCGRWRADSGIANGGALAHQATWLLLGGHGLGIPSPRLLTGQPYAKDLTATWKRSILTVFENKAKSKEARKGKTQQEARAMLAASWPWNISLLFRAPDPQPATRRAFLVFSQPPHTFHCLSRVPFYCLRRSIASDGVRCSIMHLTW